MHNLRKGCVLILVLALLLEGGMASSPAAAASASITSAAIPSNAAPEVGQEITVTINIDMSGAPEHKLGSFTGNLQWNKSVLAYKSYTGPLAGFTGLVNDTQAANGRITFNGANALGATGNVVVVTVTFDVVGRGTSALNLEYTAMAAALTFTPLLSILTVTDGQVVVGPGGLYYTYLPLLRKKQ